MKKVRLIAILFLASSLLIPMAFARGSRGGSGADCGTGAMIAGLDSPQCLQLTFFILIPSVKVKNSTQVQVYTIERWCQHFSLDNANGIDCNEKKQHEDHSCTLVRSTEGPCLQVSFLKFTVVGFIFIFVVAATILIEF